MIIHEKLWYIYLKQRIKCWQYFMCFTNCLKNKYKVKVNSVRSNNAPELHFTESIKWYCCISFVFWDTKTKFSGWMKTRAYFECCKDFVVPISSSLIVLERLCPYSDVSLSCYSTKLLMKLSQVNLLPIVKSEPLDACVMFGLHRSKYINLKIGLEHVCFWDIYLDIRDINCWIWRQATYSSLEMLCSMKKYFLVPRITSPR